MGLTGNSNTPGDIPDKWDRPTLAMLGGLNLGYVVELASEHITLRRYADNDVIFDESLSSRRHAVIIETESGFVIRDLDKHQRDVCERPAGWRL